MQSVGAGASDWIGLDWIELDWIGIGIGIGIRYESQRLVTSRNES